MPNLKDRRRFHLNTSVSIGELVTIGMIVVSLVGSTLWTQFIANSNAKRIEIIRSDIKDLRMEIKQDIKDLRRGG